MKGVGWRGAGNSIERATPHLSQQKNPFFFFSHLNFSPVPPLYMTGGYQQLIATRATNLSSPPPLHPHFFKVSGRKRVEAFGLPVVCTQDICTFSGLSSKKCRQLCGRKPATFFLRRWRKLCHEIELEGSGEEETGELQGFTGFYKIKNVLMLRKKSIVSVSTYTVTCTVHITPNFFLPPSDNFYLLQ